MRGKYEWAITDSPLLLCAYYAPKNATPHSFYKMVEEYNEKFDNINVFLTRDLEEERTIFEEQGRLHNKEQSCKIQNEQMTFLDGLSVPYKVLKIGDEDTAKELMKLVLEDK